MEQCGAGGRGSPGTQKFILIAEPEHEYTSERGSGAGPDLATVAGQPDSGVHGYTPSSVFSPLGARHPTDVLTEPQRSQKSLR